MLNSNYPEEVYFIDETDSYISYSDEAILMPIWSLS